MPVAKQLSTAQGSEPEPDLMYTPLESPPPPSSQSLLVLPQSSFLLPPTFLLPPGPDAGSCPAGPFPLEPARALPLPFRPRVVSVSR
eukprot:1103275-Rhodomonas_salina.2